MSETMNVGAAVDLGSTSVHLVVARVLDRALEPLLDESEFLGLGDVVDAGGALGPARLATVDALGRYATAARDLGAGSIAFLGTEPIRRAADSGALAIEIEAATGVRLEVLSHEEEAYLTAIGALGGRAVERPTLIIDIGGGSSEFCQVGPGLPARAHGVKLGAARLTAGHVRSDPPSDESVAAMSRAAAEILAAGPALSPAEVIVVGGTASNLLKLLPNRDDPLLTRRRLAEATATLEGETLDAIAARHGVRPARARLLPAGAAIVDALMAHFDLAEVRVSEAGLREGAIHAMAHAGDGWRDRLAELARGW